MFQHLLNPLDGSPRAKVVRRASVPVLLFPIPTEEGQ